MTAELNFKVIADEAYQYLPFSEEACPPPPLYTYAATSPVTRENVISINSFSKILAPGLRY
jgi:DNA-binding transcriptional MocR family regulator